MLRIVRTGFIAIAMPLVIGAASTSAFAVSRSGVAAGEAEARQLLRLMDTDKNGKVSRQEFMRFMEAEFDRLDVDHNGELSVQELSRFPNYGAHSGPHR